MQRVGCYGPLLSHTDESTAVPRSQEGNHSSRELPREMGAEPGSIAKEVEKETNLLLVGLRRWGLQHLELLGHLRVPLGHSHLL